MWKIKTKGNKLKSYVLVWKGYNWRNIFKFQKYEIAYFGIQLVTLSRYVHTAVLHKKADGWYLNQAVFGGVEDAKTDATWIKEQCLKGNINIYSINDTNKAETLDDYLAQPIIGIRYNFLGIIAIGLYNLFGIRPPKSDFTKSSFCSELTAFSLSLEENPMNYSPQDINDLEFLEHANENEIS